MQLSHFLLKRFGVCLVLFLLCSMAVFASDPNLYVAPQLFFFRAFESGTDPNDQLLTISNFGNGDVRLVN